MSDAQSHVGPTSTAETKPVVVTRAESADGPLSTQLKSLGLSVLLWPAFNVTKAKEEPLEAALQGLGQFNWIVFASRHAVAAVTERVKKPPAGLLVAAVGRATAQVLRQRGWTVELQPSEDNAASLVAAFASRPMRDARVLFPASSRALPTIATGLRQLGAEVMQVEAYRTEGAALDVEECRAWIARDGIAAVTFASPSAVIELEQALGRKDFERLLSSARAVAIGPTTARELLERGCTAVLAESATLSGVAQTTFRLLQTRH